MLSFLRNALLLVLVSGPALAQTPNMIPTLSTPLSASQLEVRALFTEFSLKVIRPAVVYSRQEVCNARRIRQREESFQDHLGNMQKDKDGKVIVLGHTQNEKEFVAARDSNKEKCSAMKAKFAAVRDGAFPALDAARKFVDANPTANATLVISTARAALSAAEKSLPASP